MAWQDVRWHLAWKLHHLTHRRWWPPNRKARHTLQQHMEQLARTDPHAPDREY